MTGRVRVLWLVNGLGRGGAEQLLVSLAREVDPSLVRLHVGYVLAHKNALVPDLAAVGATVQCLQEESRLWPLHLRRMLRTGRFDVVHTHSPLVAACARICAPRSAVMLHTEHNVWSQYRWPTRVLNALTIHRNELVWPVSEGVARTIRPLCRRSRRPRVAVLVHGLRFTPQARGPEARRQALQRLGLDSQTFTIGSVGNLTAKKGHDTLIEAVALLRERRVPCRLVVVGGGRQEPGLRQLVARRNLGDRVVFAGVRDDVGDLLPGFDVFAMASRHEGLPIALLEAMATGLPSVVTSVGGVPEVVTDGRDGLLVPPDDPDALCDALARLANETSLRLTLSAAAPLRAAAFGIEPAAEEITREYLRLAGASPRVSTS